jgi:hypothetical protein
MMKLAKAGVVVEAITDKEGEHDFTSWLKIVEHINIPYFPAYKPRLFAPEIALVMCTACYTKERFIYEICLAEVEKFVKIKNLVQY